MVCRDRRAISNIAPRCWVIQRRYWVLNIHLYWSLERQDRSCPPVSCMIQDPTPNLVGNLLHYWLDYQRKCSLTPIPNFPISLSQRRGADLSGVRLSEMVTQRICHSRHAVQSRTTALLPALEHQVRGNEFRPGRCGSVRHVRI